MLEFEPRRKQATERASYEEKLRQESSEAGADFEALSSLIGGLNKELEETPELVGLPAKAKAGVSQVTSGAYGFTPEQMEKRGEIVNKVSIAGFQMLKFATENGLSGINTVSEAKRAIGKLTADSTAEEIKGAGKALLDARRDMLKVLKARSGQSEEGSNDPLGLRL